MKTFQELLLVVLLSGSCWGLHTSLPEAVSRMLIIFAQAATHFKHFQEDIVAHKSPILPLEYSNLMFEQWQLERATVLHNKFVDLDPEMQEFIKQLSNQIRNLISNIEEARKDKWVKEEMKKFREESQALLDDTKEIKAKKISKRSG